MSGANLYSRYILNCILQSSNGGTGQGTLTINLIEVDKKPVFAADIFYYHVSEGTPAGTALSSSQPISSSNPNLRNIPVYRLLSSNPPSSKFSLDPLSGQLSLSAGIDLIFYSEVSYPSPQTYILNISAQVRPAKLLIDPGNFKLLEDFALALSFSVQVSTTLSLFANATVFVTGVFSGIAFLCTAHFS